MRGGMRADCSARRRRCCNGSTTLAASASPPAITPTSNATSTTTPSDVPTRVKPKSSSAGCGLSAPTTMPAARHARAMRVRIRRIIRLCGSFAGSRVDSLAESWGCPVSGVGLDGDHAAHAFAQFLARLEMRDVLARERDRITGLGIAPEARRTVVQREAAEAADFDALATRQRRAHHLEQGLHREIDVVRLQVALARGEDLDQFGLGHAGSSVAGLGFEACGGPGCPGPPTLTAVLRVAITRTCCCSAVRAGAHRAWWCRSPRPTPCCTRPGLRRCPPRPSP